MNDQERIARADSLKLIVENQHYADAVQQLQDRLNDEWRSSKPGEADVRERIYLSQKMLHALTAILRHHVETGEIDRRKLADMAGKRSRLPFQNW